LKDGIVVAGRTVKVISETPVMAVLDAEYGYGAWVTPQAVDLGIRKAREMGLACIALRNAGHVGRVGQWAERAADASLVSMHWVNASGSVLVAPHGGVDRRLSTAPHTIGIPRAGENPIVLDFATSMVAEGKVLVASQGGKDLPADALVQPDGSRTGDPRALYGDYEQQGGRDYKLGKGAIRAFGDHKGSGLAFMVELLGGSLTGTAGTSLDRGRFANGMLSIYIDPTRLDPDGFFPKDVARYTDFFKSSTPITPGGEILIPGEPEIKTRRKRLAEGVPISDDTWAAIVKAARDCGVDERKIQGALA
jgi:hydroxycarboxylate dehydrogenase B